MVGVYNNYMDNKQQNLFINGLNILSRLLILYTIYVTNIIYM